MAENPSSKLPYEDASLSIEQRVQDLLSRMTLEEKAGQLFHNMILMGPDGTLSKGNNQYGIEDTELLLNRKQMTHFNIVGPIEDPVLAATWHNRLQEAAMKTRLRIPVTVSSDPRNSFTENIGTSASAGGFSQWPETLGFGALRSNDLVEKFADCAREEYLATGIRCALHPQIDVATEPRWARASGTYGEDNGIASSFGEAYLRGFQKQDGHQSVTCLVKHFPGGGPQAGGEDAHFDYGKDQVYPGGQFAYHLEPFERAIKAGARQFMPYYGRPIGLKFDVGNGKEEDIEEVGFAFSKQLITDLLRHKMGFKGIVCTDWGLVTDAVIRGQVMPARAWGCESLTELERVVKVIDAGCDQFGGESRPELVVEAVQKGFVSENRLDESVARLLAEKFWLGLFDKRFVDIEHVKKVFGRSDVKESATDAQRQSLTLLKNSDELLPLKSGMEGKVYVEGIEPSVLERRMPKVSIVTTPGDANLAILRLKAPFEPRSGGFEAFFHAGSLEYSAEEKARQKKIYTAVPTIVDMYLDRAAVIPEINEKVNALLVNYGASPDVFFDVLLGTTTDGRAAKPKGKLPFDMPSSTKAVEANKEDTPWDTKDPLFRFGTGLSYT